VYVKFAAFAIISRMPLTPLEEYFLREDRQAYPWSFFVRLDFTGCVDRQAAEDSLRSCVGRHPLLSSVVRSEGRALVWQTVDNPMPAVGWTTPLADMAYLPAERLDIAGEIGIRVHFAVGQESTRLIFQFNHASCDARGATTFIDDWLAEYGRATGEGVVYGAPRMYDPAMLQHRDCLGPPMTTPMEGLRARWAGLLRAGSFLRHSPVPLVDHCPAQGDAATPLGYPAARHYRFDETATSQIRSVAKRHGATINDLLCCDLFLAIQAFRREMGQRPDVCLRIVVPVDLRTQSHRRMSAANATSLVFLTRPARACNDPASLLQGIHEEMHQVKKWRLARMFIRGLLIRRFLPGGLARGVRNSKCQGTATMTNVGDIFAGSSLPRKDDKLVAGNLLLESADFLAPIRPLTCASFSASTYADRLSLNLHYDPRVLSDASSIRLCDLLIARLRSRLR
jgi:hypothetical protein